MTNRDTVKIFHVTVYYSQKLQTRIDYLLLLKHNGRAKVSLLRNVFIHLQDKISALQLV